MMKKQLKRILSAALVLFVSSVSVPAFAAEPEEIVILHTNDVHCAIDQAVDDTGKTAHLGYAGVAAYKQEMEAAFGADNVVLVDAGDAIQGEAIGTLSEGAYPMDIMNQAGYDYAIPGNHEFDFGLDRFLNLAKKRADYKYLCANFLDSKGAPVFDPYSIMDFGETQVAFVGISTPESFTKSTPTYFQNKAGKYIYSFCEGGNGKALYSAVQAAVNDARKAGADYVVALGHLGEEGSTPVWRSSAVAANTTGIDVIIDGHSHEQYEKNVNNKEGKPVLLVQTGTKLAGLGKIVIDPKTGAIHEEFVTGYSGKDPKVANYIAAVEAKFNTILKEQVGSTKVALTTLDPKTGERAVRNAETNLGDFCADAYRAMMDADVAFMNGGGIRADIAAGSITYEQVINVHPYGNAVCLVEVAGQQILDALEMGARQYPEESGGFLQVSGLTYNIDGSIPSSVAVNDKGEFQGVNGPYRVSGVKVNGAPLDLKKNYKLASHDYMLKNAGDGFTMFQDCKILRDSVMVDNQALIRYLKEKLNGAVGEAYADPAGEGRITFTQGAAANPSVVTFTLDALRAVSKAAA